MCSLIKCLFACFIPPIAVLIDRGCKCDFLLNLFLTLLGYFPGCIHAYCVICEKRPQPYAGPANITIQHMASNPAPIVIDRLPAPGQYNWPPPPVQPQMYHSNAQHPGAYIPGQMSAPMHHQMSPQQMQPLMSAPPMTSHLMEASAPPPPSYMESASSPAYEPYNEKGNRLLD